MGYAARTVLDWRYGCVALSHGNCRSGGLGRRRVGRAPQRRPAPTSQHTVEKVPVAVGYGGAVVERRRGRLRRRHRGPEEGRQRGRRGRRHRRRARRHRALLRPASAEAATSSTTTPSPVRCTPSTAARPRPLTADSDLFLENGKPLAFADAVTSGLSVGTPGTPATWQTALDTVGQQEARHGPEARRADRPRRLHRRRHLPLADRRRTRPGSATSRTRPSCSCPAGSCRSVGSTFKNPDLARTYEELAQEGRRRDLPRRPRQGHRRHREQPARGPGFGLERPPGRAVRQGPRGLPRQAPGAHEDLVPRSRRLLHRALLLRRHDRRRGAQHPGEDRPFEGERGPVPAPLHRGQPHRVRGPRALGRRPRLRGRTDEGTAVAEVRRLAGVPHQGRRGAHQPGRARRPAASRGLRRRAARRPRRRTRARTRRISRSPTSGATSSPTRSPSSRPAAARSPCPAAGSSSTTS